MLLICPDCHDWEFHPRDRFCGGCGRSYIQVKATVGNALHYKERPIAAVAVELRNTGRIPTGGGKVRVVTEGGRELWAEQLPSEALAMQGDVWKGSWKPRAGTNPTVAELRFQPTNAGQELVLATLGFGLTRAVVGLEEDGIVLDMLAISSMEDMSVKVPLRLLKGQVGRLRGIVLVDDNQGAGTTILADDQNQEPLILRPNRLTYFDLPLTAELWSRIMATPAGVNVTLRISLDEQEQPTRLSLRLSVRTVASIEVKVLERWRLQVDRPGLAFIGVANVGGQSGRILSLTMALRAPMPLGGAEATGRLEFRANLPEQGLVLVAGERRHVALNLPVLSSTPVEYQGILTAVLADGLPPVQQLVVVSVRSAQVLDGNVAIDFGTTETAMAIRRRDAGPEPAILRLEEEGEFLPTVIAYTVDANGSLRTLIGRQARMPEATADQRTLIIEGLKWRLTEAGEVVRPDGTVCHMLEVAADYLRAVRQRAEERIEIGAGIREVYITVPSRFSPSQVTALLEAFRLAGMSVRMLSINRQPTLVSESWPPACLALPIQSLSALSKRALRDDIPLAGVSKGRFGLVTFDMGGGSTDVSAFLVSIENLASINSREVFTDGSNDISGNIISRLLTQALMPSLRMAMMQRGILEINVPIHPPWDPSPGGYIDRLGGDNGRNLAKMVWALQANPALAAPLDLDNLESEANQPLIEQMAASVISNTRLPPVELRDRSGNLHQFAWGEGGVSLNISAFLHSFVSGPVAVARRLVQDAASALAANGEREANYIIMTGRGSMFALMGPLLDAQVKRLWETEQPRFRMDDGMLKPITSLGALFLARSLNNAPGIRFSSGLSTWFGFQGDLDPDTGHPQFIVLCQGLPKTVVVAPLPLSWDDEFRLILGISMFENGELAASSFRPDFELDIVLADTSRPPRFVRVEPSTGSDLTISIVRAKDAQMAATSGGILFSTTLSLLPAGYQPPPEGAAHEGRGS